MSKSCSRPSRWLGYAWWASLAVISSLLLSHRTTASSAAAVEPREHGVVVEEVGELTALERADLRAGDKLLSWRRLPGPTDPEGAAGELTSPFDWFLLTVEQAPRGTVQLTGRRAGEDRSFEITPGPWEAEVRPRMSDASLRDYVRGLEHYENGDPAEAAARWMTIASATEDWRLRCWILLQLGGMWAEEKDWEQAHAAYRSALAEAPEPSPKAVLWQLIGQTYEQQSDFESALQAYNSLRKIREKTLGEESLAFAEALHFLGEVAWKRGDLEQMTEYSEQALEIRQELAPGSLIVAQTLNNLGIVPLHRGDLERATDFFQRALDIQQELAPGRPILGSSLANLGTVFFYQGDLDRATELLERSLEIKQTLEPESLSVASSLQNLGGIALSRGDLDQALGFVESALEMRQKLVPDGLPVAQSLNHLGLIAAKRGNWDRATDLFQRALDIQKRLAPDNPDLATSLHNLAGMARERGDPDRAFEYYQQALEIHQRLAPDSLFEARSLNSLGYLARERGDLEAAADIYQRALGICQRLAPNSLDMAVSLYGLGVVAWEDGDPERAAGFCQRALEIQTELAPSSAGIAETLHQLALLHLRKSPPEPAAAAGLLRRALEALDSQLSQLGGSHDVRAGFRARHHEYYRLALDVQVQLGQPDIAFHTLERSRARSFLEQLGERDSVFTVDIPEDLDQERRRVAVRFDRAQKQLARLNPQDHGPRVEGLQVSLRRLRDEARDIEEKIRRASPRLAALQYPQPLDLEATRAALDPGTLMLSYSVGETSTLLFAVAPDGTFRIATLALGRDDLRGEVQLMRGLIEQATPGSSLGALRGKDLDRVSKSLYKSLLQPVESMADSSERLLLIPDGPLRLLPFAALVRETDEGGAQYLAQWKPLHSVLSATVYAELRKSRRSAPQDSGGDPLLAAFGDPHYALSRQFAAAGGERISDARVRSARERRGLDWHRLSESRREVLEISELYRNVRTYLGEGATEERVKALGGDARLVHFATHATLDDRFPLNSALVLTLPEGFPENRDNGLLQAWEIFERVRLDADLVVLSACESALGEEQGGDGLIGLTRAFQYAGARTVAASLWSVQDRATSELMVRFYRHLRSGLSKDEALRAAQLELIRGPLEVLNEAGEQVRKDWTAPYYWAAFQIAGDWQ